MLCELCSLFWTCYIRYKATQTSLSLSKLGIGDKRKNIFLNKPDRISIWIDINNGWHSTEDILMDRSYYDIEISLLQTTCHKKERCTRELRFCLQSSQVYLCHSHEDPFLLFFSSHDRISEYFYWSCYV